MRAPPGPRTPPILSGAITPAELRMLAPRLGGLLADAGGEPVICDVSRLDVDLAAVDALGRLQLAARRLGGAIAVRGVSPELAGLLEFCGIARAIPRLDCGLVGGGREAGGEPEQGKHTTDVEERVQPGDLPA